MMQWQHDGLVTCSPEDHTGPMSLGQFAIHEMANAGQRSDQTVALRSINVGSRRLGM